MRYLAELPWAPDAILTNDDLDWTELASDQLRVVTVCAGVRAEVTFALGENGLIAAVEAPDRPRLEGASLVERPWRGEFFDYRSVSGRLIPHTASVGWVIDNADLVVWRGRVRDWRCSGP